MNRIYLISESGAAWGSDEGAAKALEAVGYRRCSRSAYYKKRRQMRDSENEAGLVTGPLRKP